MLITNGALPTRLRLVVRHFFHRFIAGTPDGFINGALDLFIGVTNSGDYHHEMNAEHYHKYMEESLGPNLPDKCVVIIDRASYHTVKTGKYLGDFNQQFFSFLAVAQLAIVALDD